VKTNKAKNANVREIRSRGLSQVNRLVSAHQKLELFKGAFAEWRAGDIYVCKKTGDYRHRYGDLCRSVTAWNKEVRAAFSTPAHFALAALVFDDGQPVATPKSANTPKAPKPIKSAAAPTGGRANIIHLATKKEVAA